MAPSVSSVGRDSNSMNASAISQGSSIRGCQRPKTRSLPAYSLVMPVRTNGSSSVKQVTRSALRPRFTLSTLGSCSTAQLLSA